jgi:hypothetical protein
MYGMQNKKYSIFILRDYTATECASPQVGDADRIQSSFVNSTSWQLIALISAYMTSSVVSRLPFVVVQRHFMHEHGCITIELCRSIIYEPLQCQKSALIASVKNRLKGANGKSRTNQRIYIRSCRCCHEILFRNSSFNPHHILLCISNPAARSGLAIFAGSFSTVVPVQKELLRPSSLYTLQIKRISTLHKRNSHTAACAKTCCVALQPSLSLIQYIRAGRTGHSSPRKFKPESRSAMNAICERGSMLRISRIKKYFNFYR